VTGNKNFLKVSVWLAADFMNMVQQPRRFILTTRE